MTQTTSFGRRQFLASGAALGVSAIGLAGWPRYALANRPTMRFDTTSAVVNDPLAERRQLWASAQFQ